MQPGVFVSPYFSKEAAVSTWGHEVYGIGIVRPFIQDNENKMFIPDPTTKKDKGRRQTRRIRNGMDESEASKAQKALQPMWIIESQLQEVSSECTSRCC